MAKTNFCPHCGEVIDSKATVCTTCGRKVTPEAEVGLEVNQTEHTQSNEFLFRPRGPYNKWIALVLCLFLGVFGAHKFYEGRYGMGIIYLVTGGLCGVGVVFDIITLLLKPTRYYLYF